MSNGRVLQYALSLDDGDETLLRVVRFEVEEALCEGSRGWVEVETTEVIDAASLPGKRYRLRILQGDGRPARCFHGLVYAATSEAFQPEHFRLRFEVGSRLHLLELGQEVRLHQEQSVPDVVKAVLEEAGISEDSQSWTLAESPPVRPAVTQYNECDHTFVRRLLAEEGIVFAVRNDDEGESLAFFDGPDGLVPLAGEGALRVRTQTHTDEDTVLSLSERHAAGSDAVMVRDHDPKQPTVDLSHREEAPESRGREVYLHPGGFDAMGHARRRAKRVLEQHRSRAVAREGTSDCPQLEPGRTFVMDGHPRMELNGEQVVLSVVHRGGLETRESGASEETYENTFRAVPGQSPFFRPEAPAERAAPGVEVAFVTGAAGQELHGSERGEVRVRFPWDRSGLTDDRSSPWLRVGQLALGGSMIIPRVGFEVMVDHELGDRDRPLVVGHLYNGEAMPPYALPDHATRSSIQTATTGGGPGANELRFEDAAGSEEIFFNASHDLTVSVEHDANLKVLVDEATEVGGNRTFSVGANHTLQVTRHRSLKVGANQRVNVDADLSDGVGGDSAVQVGATRKLTVGGDLTENTQGPLERTVGGLQAVTGLAGYERKVVGSSKTKVGAAWLETTADSRMSTCGAARVETVGALKMVKARTVAVSCGAAYALTAAAEKVKVGGNRVDKAEVALAITASGGLSVQAENINITGETKVVLKVGGSTVEVTPSGVKIKSPEIQFKGVKEFSSLSTHKSN
ncbi:type VI secretion system tip protein VgrG [Myxococcus sp. K15C18031901]|uniref:type VI secretion system Vgr family protein n=1 Tax=Myxococcus dinghuensis TaxID=2906761 RepID=UPI0020A6F587|nr:type VI secretion system tip protein TssI/VgrG [Myxococcus dinghuensis]MCP3098216.1 type VI secretion system tip protein VgrG [Myxococcus dinghuensis]